MTQSAILLMAYGSPEREEDIEAYYTDIRRGTKPTPSELQNLKERYEKIGGRSPLPRITTSTSEKLELSLTTSGNRVRVYSGMKHWHPYISEVIENILADGSTRLLSLALAPHYSKMSIGTYEESVRKANSENGEKMKLEFIDQWCGNRIFLEKWANRIESALGKFGTGRDQIFFLFTAHSLPERILAMKDPYRDQLYGTMRDLSQRLALRPSQFDFAFQSAGHTSEPWLGPDILEKLKTISVEGWKNVLVAPVGFVSDHLEILFDLDIEAKKAAEDLGIHLERTESFNDSIDFVDILTSVVMESGFLQ